MKKTISILSLIILLVACKNDSISNEFNCKDSTIDGTMKEYRDVLKKFKINIPNNWKTSLYYDEYQSEIYTADTTKSLTETYIIDIAWHQGELNLNEAFAQRVKDTLAIKENLSVVKSNFSRFQDKQCYWTLSKGKNNNYAYNNLQLYVKTEVDEYYTFTTKVYGDNNIDDRLCQAIKLSENIKFIE